MNSSTDGTIVYVMKRYPRLSETFILNEIRAMERLGTRMHIYSLLPPEPPPHHPMVAEVKAQLHALPARLLTKARVVAGAHARMLAAAPLRYAGTALRALFWSAATTRPWSVWKQFARSGFLADTCRQAGIRHIHAHFANAPAAVAHFASLMAGVTFSFTAHAKDLYLTRPRVIRRRARAATFVATCTGYNVRYLHGLLGTESDKVQLVYHGIDLSQFGAAAPVQAVPDASPLLLSVGRLVEKKGHDDLIAACAMLRNQGRLFRCMIVGEGPLRQALEAQIADLGLTDTVTLAGAMTHADLVHLYTRASVFALAPRITENGDRDGIPNVIAEAMAAGVPVVSTEVSGIPELVVDGHTGLLVPSNQPERLAAAIERLLGDTETAAALAGAARGRLASEFDLWTTTRKLHGLIDHCACGDHHAPTDHLDTVMEARP